MIFLFFYLNITNLIVNKGRLILGLIKRERLDKWRMRENEMINEEYWN